MSDKQIYTEIDGPIAYLKLNRPEKRNALTEAMWSAIPKLLAPLEANPDVRLLIIESTSAGMFTAGADIVEFKELASMPDRRAGNRAAIVAGQHAIAHFAKPTIAVVDGVARGAGVGLAVAADFRIITEGTSFAVTPAKLGLVYPLEDTKRLVDLVGATVAKRLIFTAEVVEADAALAMGLADQVTSSDELSAVVAAFASALCDHSPHTIREMKKIIQLIQDGQAMDDRVTEDAFMDAYSGDDFAEGVAAFFEKRKPKF